MSAYILIMIIAMNNGAMTTVQLPNSNQPQFDQQTCSAIEQDINKQVTGNEGTVISQNCYSIPGGYPH